jgi:hypothetical protein
VCERRRFSAKVVIEFQTLVAPGVETGERSYVVLHRDERSLTDIVAHESKRQKQRGLQSYTSGDVNDSLQDDIEYMPCH